MAPIDTNAVPETEVELDRAIHLWWERHSGLGPLAYAPLMRPNGSMKAELWIPDDPAPWPVGLKREWLRRANEFMTTLQLELANLEVK